MVAEISFPVRYVETDAQRVVYYANHLAWFELGYEALFSTWGMPLGEERPLVREAACRYLVPVRYGRQVTVRSTLVEGGREGLWIAHGIYVGGRLCARGSTLLSGQRLPPAARLEPGPVERLEAGRALLPHGRVGTTALRVRYAETEPSRGAHYAHYFQWFEVGRVAFLRLLGVDYARLEDSGIRFVIAWAGCRYHTPVRFDDPLVVSVWVEEVRRRAFSLGYRIVETHQQQLVAEGLTVQAFIDETGRSAAMPSAIRSLLLEASSGP